MTVYIAILSTALVASIVGTYLSRRLADRILIHLAGVSRPIQALDLIACGIGRRGTIYVTLAALERDGLIRSWNKKEPLDEMRGFRPRRLYEITDKGRRAAQWLTLRG